MKRTLLLILIFLPMLASAQNAVEIDGIYYNLKTEEKTAEVTQGPYQYYKGDVTIPESFEYGGMSYSVTNIGSHAFIDCIGMTSITIPKSVTSMGVGVFMNCSGLTSVTIPNSVTTIGVHVFSNCIGLTSINVETGNTKYDSRDNCNAIIETESNTLIAGCKNTTIPNSVTIIGNYAFEYCLGLTSITIPNSVTSIGAHAFMGCSELTSIIIPNSVTSIGGMAFYGCLGLTSITIPNSVTIIGNEAFSYCTGLTSINVESENTKYDSRDNCNAIIETVSNTLIAGCQNTIIPNSVASIGVSAFNACSGLTSITIPNGVTSIGNYAFLGCIGLTSIIIPNSVTSIGVETFEHCPCLLDMFCYAENVPTTGNNVFNRSNIANATLHVPAASMDAYKAVDPWKQFKVIMALDDDEMKIVKYDLEGIYYYLDTKAKTAEVTENPNYYTGDVTIPETFEYGGTAYNVTSIGNGAFSECLDLTSVNIPNSVTSIGDKSFWECVSMSSVNIPNSVTSIGQHVFDYCWSLTSIKVEEGNTTYDSRNNCNAIIETNTNKLIYGCKNSRIPNGVTSIRGYAFSYCRGLHSINIPNSVTSIEDYAIFGSSTLLDVFCYAENVPTTGNNAFYTPYIPNTTLHVPVGSVEAYKATEPWNQFKEIVALNGEEFDPDGNGLIDDVEISGIYYDLVIDSKEAIVKSNPNKYQGNVTIPATVDYGGTTYSVTSIGERTFYDCSALTSITIPEGITSIGNNTFAGCSGLTSITIPDGVTSIGESAFEGCSGLTSITIPNSVTTIGKYAIKCCSGLTSITIPNGVTSIDEATFYECSGLTSITIPSNVTTIGQWAFYGCSNLLDMFCYAENVPKTGNNVFNRSNIANATLHVPAASMDAYKAVDPWKQFKEIVALPDLERKMLEQGKTWVYEYHDFDEEEEFDHDEEVFDVSYTIQGDTVIGGVSYVKLMRQQDGVSTYYAALREEGTAVFRVMAGKSNEYKSLEFDPTKLSSMPNIYCDYTEHKEVIKVNGREFVRHIYEAVDEPLIFPRLIAVEGVGFRTVGIFGVFQELPTCHCDYESFKACYEDGECIFTNEDFNTTDVIAQTDGYYYYQGKKIPLTKNENKVCISIPKDCDKTYERIRAIFQVLTKINDNDLNIFVFSRSDFEKLTSQDFWEEDVKSVIITSCYFTEDNKEVAASPYLNVELKTEEDIDLLTSYAEKYKLRFGTLHYSSMPLWYVLAITPDSEKNSVECANELYESGVFASAVADFVHLETPKDDTDNFNYIPFVKDGKGKIWHVVRSDLNSSHTEQYMLAYEDVVKDGKTYLKMCRSMGDRTEIQDVGLFREEDRKVYFIAPDMQEEHLMFDFSLKEGDTYETYSYDEEKVVSYEVVSVEDYLEGPEHIHYIEKEDGLITQHRYLRKWTVCRTDDKSIKVWIEGVGSLEGPLGNLHDVVLPGLTKDYLAYVEKYSGYLYLPFSFYDTLNKQAHGCDLPTSESNKEYDDELNHLTYELEGDRLHVYGEVFGNCGPNQYAYFYEKPTDDPLVHRIEFEIQEVEPLYWCKGLHATDFYVPGSFDPNINYIVVDNNGEEHPVINKTQQMAYRPFVEDGKVWKVGSTLIRDNLVKMVAYYYFDGDTIIDGKTCKQMMCQRYVNPEYPDYAIVMQYPLLQYVGAWYEEDKKVYFYNANNKQMKLMYDFSVDDNTPLQIHGQSYVIGPKQTGGIKGFKGVYRDVMMYWDEEQNIYNTTWLEGVGCIDGPTVSVYLGEENHAMFLMSCTVGDEVIYLNDDYDDAATPEGARKRRFDFTHTIKIQPKARITRNRSGAESEESLYGEYNEQQLSIYLDPIDDTYLVSITSESGKVVYEKEINAGNIVGLNIDISSYSESRYTVTVENSRESFTGEFETGNADVDGDGILTAKDIIAIVNVISGKTTDEAIKSAADVNSDGVVDAADIIRIANKIVRK